MSHQQTLKISQLKGIRTANRKKYQISWMITQIVISYKYFNIIHNNYA
jgi:hypothetical protein